MGSSFERKRMIHGYDWDGLNRSDKSGFIHRRTGEKIKDEIFITFDVLDCEIILGKPSFQVEQLLVREQFVLKVKNLWKR